MKVFLFVEQLDLSLDQMHCSQKNRCEFFALMQFLNFAIAHFKSANSPDLEQRD